MPTCSATRTMAGERQAGWPVASHHYDGANDAERQAEMSLRVGGRTGIPWCSSVLLVVALAVAGGFWLARRAIDGGPPAMAFDVHLGDR